VVCHSQRSRTLKALCHFLDISQLRLICHIGTVPSLRFDFFRFARIIQDSFWDLILIVVVGVSIRPKMSKSYQFGVTQAVAFGIPAYHPKKGYSSMSPLRSGLSSLSRTANHFDKGLVSLLHVCLHRCQRVQNRIRVHRP
jgi:hypothetical protein